MINFRLFLEEEEYKINFFAERLASRICFNDIYKLENFHTIFLMYSAYHGNTPMETLINSVFTPNKDAFANLDRLKCAVIKEIRTESGQIFKADENKYDYRLIFSNGTLLISSGLDNIFRYNYRPVADFDDDNRIKGEQEAKAFIKDHFKPDKDTEFITNRRFLDYADWIGVIPDRGFKDIRISIEDVYNYPRSINYSTHSDDNTDNLSTFKDWCYILMNMDFNKEYFKFLQNNSTNKRFATPPKHNYYPLQEFIKEKINTHEMGGEL